MQINFETTSNLATLVSGGTFKAGSQVPVVLTLTTNGNPYSGAAPSLMGLGITTQSSSPATLAYLDTWTAVNGNTWAGILNANDTRLVAFFAALASAPLNLELAVTISGEEFIAPNLAVQVQQQQISGPASSEGGPTWATTTMVAAAAAALAWTAAVLDLSTAGVTTLVNAAAWLLGRQPVSLGAGSGAYVQSIVLSDSNALAGALMRVPIDFPASANPTINVYDSSVEGTLLEGPLTNPNPGAAASFLLTLGFDGAAWHKESGQWVV
jgi:hypothetical protein